MGTSIPRQECGTLSEGCWLVLYPRLGFQLYLGGGGSAVG